MGYQIFTGHRLETLVEDHLDLFRSGFFGPRPGIVLQNQSLAQWLKLFLAGKIGGYVTGDFLYQDEALRRLMENRAVRSERLLFLDDLKFELYLYFAAALTANADPVFGPLLGGGGVPDPLRLFELADHVAGVFHNYAMNSDLWPRALASGVAPSGCEDPNFAWQSRLWRDLLSGERGTLAGLVMERLSETPPPREGPPSALILVGSAFLSRRAAAFLTAWAQAGLVDIVQLLLLPAPHPSFGGWPAKRPWSSWGTFGRAFLQAFPAPTASSTVEHSDSPTALESLQAALARGESFPPVKPDGTLEIVSCPHPLRELELLRDRLLAALALDPTLEMNEIAVLAPDINVYAPFLDAAFASDDPGRNLKYHVIDLNLGRENTWFKALDALLALVSGTIDRPMLFTLIDTPAFQEAWKIEGEERDLWLDYTEEVSAWREEPQADTAPQTWSASWNRLFTGWFRTSAATEEVPPLDTAPSAFRALGRFQQLLESLRARGRETKRRRSFVEWIRFLDQSVAEFLAPGEGTGAVLSGRLRTLAADAGSPEDLWPWAGFRAFVQDQIAHFPGRRGQLLTEGLHCSSLRPLRAIPFRIIAVLGLDEGRFPHQVPQPSFDLRRHEVGQEEVSSLALDRYSFWETVMAARSLLYLSYQGRSPVDGSLRPPSSVLADLADFLEGEGPPWPVTEGSVKDFSVLKGSPPTGSPRTLRRALAASGPVDSPPQTGRPVLSETETFTEVRQSEVAQAFTTPAKFHLRRVGQVFLGDEDRRGVDDEEPWSLSFLDRHGWLQDQLRRAWDGDQAAWNVDEFLSRMEATGRVRRGIFADRDRRELKRRSLQAASWANDLKTEGWNKENQTRPRTLWAGLPWAAEPGEELTRGTATLLPRLLYAEKPPVRSLIESAVRVLQDPHPEVVLATLSPSGARVTLRWAYDAQQTGVLAALAESYWRETVRRPLPFYPDYLEALAFRREKQPQEPWRVSAESAWRKSRENSFTESKNTLAMDPYAALAFAEPPLWADLEGDLERWWSSLFLPLLKAWQ